MLKLQLTLFFKFRAASDNHKLLLRSPKRQSNTVYEKVCAKLTRTLTSSISSPSLKKAPLATEEDESDLKVTLRSRGRTRRCQSEVTPAKTAELLAKFVASRTMDHKAPAPSSVKKVEAELEAAKKHQPLPKATEDLTQPIMYIDKKTGVLSVDMMWTCTKCSFAYNKIEAGRCEVCSVVRTSSNSSSRTEMDGDFQLVTADLIQVMKFS